MILYCEHIYIVNLFYIVNRFYIDIVNRFKLLDIVKSTFYSQSIKYDAILFQFSVGLNSVAPQVAL